jgi:tripartite-type tricarboxylate transporter receptor subunit TctC
MTNGLRSAGLACALLIAGVAQAQSNGAPGYPSHPIHWILPGAAGSPPDVAVRIVGEGLARELGQPVIIENRPGASGTIALAAVAKSAPDGYTLGFLSVPLMAAPSLIPALPYDTLHDFIPVAQLARVRFLLAVRADSPFRSLEGLISSAKANPGRLTFASVGNGSVPHLAGELLRLRAGIDIRHIPYKSGPFAFTALLGGQVDMVFAPPSTLAAHLKSGKLRALATLEPSRLPEYPEVPTIAQAGFPGMEMGDWFNMVAPAGTPQSIVDRLSAAVRKVLGRSDASGRLAAAGFAPAAESGPDKLAGFVESELKRWAVMVREAGIHGD